MSKFYYSLFFICTILTLTALPTAAQADKDGQPAANSALIGVRLPGGALRLKEQDVPVDINAALGKLIAASGNPKLRQGATEVLAWVGNGYRQSNAPRIIKQVTDNMQNGGWEYAVAEQNSEFIVFSSLNSSGAPNKRGVVGFWVPANDSLLLAWTEMLPVGAANADSPKTNNRPANRAARPDANDASAKVVNVEKNQLSVNVMGNEMPLTPEFPALAPKPGRVRGYVKDWTGKPLAGATIGVRGSYFAGQYSGGQSVTDANGYYEFVVPKGTAHFYNAGYQIEWGNGIAAVSLHPADGTLDSFTTASGAVENFVLLPYGVTSRENLQKNPRVASTYYGGSIYVHYYAAEAGDNRPMAGSIVENSMLEITLTPEDSDGKTLVIRQPVGFAGNVTINNIPLGRYKIAAKAGGKTLKLKENRKSNQMFGLAPSETTGAASILFAPNQAKASMVAPQNGAWDSISLDVSMP